MSYTVTGRLLLANSFTQLSPKILRDLTRIYPFHSTPLTARPVDAFISPHPQVYDFRISPQWHQVVFYNTEPKKETAVSVKLSGDTSEGGLGLERGKSYHVYDFWNDHYVGVRSGDNALTQTLRPNEARMLSLREVLDRPQVVSTDRHLMQGLLELDKLKWNPAGQTLSGTARLVAGDAMVITLASNGFKPMGFHADEGVEIGIDPKPAAEGLIRFRVKADVNRNAAWSVKFGN